MKKVEKLCFIAYQSFWFGFGLHRRLESLFRRYRDRFLALLCNCGRKGKFPQFLSETSKCPTGSCIRMANCKTSLKIKRKFKRQIKEMLTKLLKEIL
jgi:hypothetical protein